MATDCEDCPLRRKPLFAQFDADDLKFSRRFKVGEMVVDRGTPILSEGSSAPQLYTVLRGMGVRYKTVSNGRRQVINFILPGDFLGLQAAVMGEMGHSIEASTRMTLCVFDRSEFWSFVRTNAERAYDIIWLAATEETFLGEALTSVGQRTAVERIAWALVRIARRAEALGLGDGHGVPLPFRQQDLADALGLSLVHTNKTLARLRERQLVAWSGGRVTISDIDALARIGQCENETPPVRPLI